MNILDKATSARLPRRGLLKGAAALGMGLGLNGIGAPQSAEAGGGGPESGAAMESIQDILNITVTTEMFGVTILGAGLESNRLGNFDMRWPANVVAVITAARAQEQFHLDFFRSLGGVPLTQTFNVPDPAILTNMRVFFNTVQEQETREVAAQLAAMTTFTAMNRLDLVKVSYQYAAEEAEHRVLANYVAGVRPANNYAFSPLLYGSVAEYLGNLRQLGIIGGSGPAAMFPGPGAIDPTNVTYRTPDATS